MVTLGHCQGDSRVERAASDGVVATTTVKEGTDPVGALSHSPGPPVSSQAGRHRQTDVRTLGVGQTVPQCGAEVVRFEIQRVKRSERGHAICPGDIEFGERTEARIEQEVGVTGDRLLTGFHEPQERELAHALVQAIARPSARALTSNEGTLDEIGDRIHYVRRPCTAGLAYLLCRLKTERTGEDAHPSQDYSVVLRQEIVAPGDGGFEGLMAQRCGSAPPDE